MFATLFALAPCVWATTYELEPGWVLEQWTVDDGLPSDTVFDVARDPDGGLLLGTGDGLVRFDGRRLTVLHAGDPGGPPDDRVVSLMEDGAGGVWLLTESAAVQHRTTAGILDYGRLAPTTRPVQWFADTAHPLVFTGVGVYELRDPPALRADLPPGSVSMLSDDEGLLLDNGQTGVTARSLEGPWEPVPPEVSRRRYDASDVARRRSRRYAFDLDGVRREGRVLLDLGWRALTVLEIGDETWVATGGAGLVRVRPTPLRVHPPPRGVRGAAQIVLDVLSGALWAGGGNPAAWWSLDGPNPRFERVEIDGGVRAVNSVAEVLPLSTPRVRWWWTFQGMRPQLSRDEEDPLVLGAPVSAPCEAVLQAAWRLPDGALATPHGDVYAADGPWRGGPHRCDKRLTGTRAALVLPGVGVLLGGFSGLSLLPDGGGAAVALPGPDGLHVRHLRLDDGRIWMATELEGLCALALDQLSEGGWRCIGSQEGLGVSLAHASFADRDGHTWVSTNRGLRVAETAALVAFADGHRDEVPFVTLDRAWGLLSPELNGNLGFSGLQGEDGRLWFPGAGGVVEVHPGELTVPGTLTAKASPPIPAALAADHAPVVTRILVEPLSWAPQVQLRYRIAGQPWVRTDAELHLGSFPPGESTVEVEARLLGDWAPVLSTRVYRTPRFTERAVFPLLVALGALLTLVLAGLVRNRALSAQRRALAAEVNRQTTALAEQNQQLIAQAVELTVQNETISQQATRLQELDGLKRKLIADLAHELRTPLTLVMGALGQPSPDVRTANRNASRLKTLLDELFDLSRLESGALRPRLRRIDLRALVTSLAERFRLAFVTADRELSLIVPAAPLPVWGDPHLLEKVVGNLLVNTLRHGAGPTELRLRADEASAWIEVADAGPGVPPADRERIFERFVQLSTGDTREREGAGIGLSLARDLVELHGGEIRVGDAARFSVRLPLGLAHVALDDVDLDEGSPAAPATHSLPPDPSPPPHPSRPAHPSVPLPPDGAERAPPAPGERPAVLLVEDNDELRSYMAGLLRARWTVAEARDGREGLDAVRRLRPDVVVSDVRMPRLDGLAMVRALRADPAVGDTPVLLVSAKTQEEDRVAGLELAQDYLCKPFGAAELVARTENLLRGPLRPAPVIRPEHEQAFLDALATAVSKNLRDPDFSAADLARALAMSPRTLQARMKDLDLPPPVNWLLEARLREAQSLLRSGRYPTVSEVASAVGLSRAYFTRAYTAWAGHPPGRGPTPPADPPP